MTKSLYASFDSTYDRIKEILENARSRVYNAANSEMVIAYWNIGRTIVEEKQKGTNRADYRKQLVVSLSARLTAEFGKGFDKTNIWNMISFYRTFPIIDAVRQQLSWTHYRLLMRVENDNAREFYIQEAIEGNWSTRQLDFYVRFFEDQVKQEGDNSTIGLILCTKKDNTIVKYSILSWGKQIFASKYKLYLPDEEILKEEINRERNFLETEESLRK